MTWECEWRPRLGLVSEELYSFSLTSFLVNPPALALSEDGQSEFQNTSADAQLWGVRCRPPSSMNPLLSPLPFLSLSPLGLVWVLRG